MANRIQEFLRNTTGQSLPAYDDVYRWVRMKSIVGLSRDQHDLVVRYGRSEWPAETKGKPDAWVVALVCFVVFSGFAEHLEEEARGDCPFVPDPD